MKQLCECEVVKVDGEKPPIGWECRCFDIGTNVHVASIKGPPPDLDHYQLLTPSNAPQPVPPAPVPGKRVTSASGLVVDPVTGEIYVVEIVCMCPELH